VAINGGSSTVKCAVFTCRPQPELVARGVVDGTASASVPRLLEWVDAHAAGLTVAGIGHRIVHGGPMYREPQPITPAVVDDLVRLVPFAPNHLPAEIALIDAFTKHAPA